MKKIGVVLLLITMSLLTFWSCKKNDLNSTFPTVSVNKYIYLNMPQYNTLQVVGNWMYIDDAGYKGLIVYHLSLDQFVAYDRGCPYDPTATNAILKVLSGTFTIKDDNCGSTFNMIDGSVTHNPATTPLRYYKVEYDATNMTLLVHN